MSKKRVRQQLAKPHAASCHSHRFRYWHGGCRIAATKATLHVGAIASAGAFSIVLPLLLLCIYFPDARQARACGQSAPPPLYDGLPS
mmetsp:Transcript_137038/g.437419  ORF Transcript_137038/g.437419 Transcript_137038/m.437419 type:complete len:87 (+) Transcript_137038:26-286(+)